MASGKYPRNRTYLLRGRSFALAVIRGDQDDERMDDSYKISLGKGGAFLRGGGYAPRGGTYFFGVVGSLATPLRIWSAIREYKEVGVPELRRLYPILEEVVAVDTSLLSKKNSTVA